MSPSNKKPTDAPRPLVTRKQAKEILNTSYENVRKLEKKKKLDPVVYDREGHVRYHRGVVEALARERNVVPDSEGERAATVFRMIREKKQLADIVMETKLAPSAVMQLHRLYELGFQATTIEADFAREQRLQEEHDALMARFDEEDARRRERMEDAVDWGDDIWPEPGSKK